MTAPNEKQLEHLMAEYSRTFHDDAPSSAQRISAALFAWTKRRERELEIQSMMRDAMIELLSTLETGVSRKTLEEGFGRVRERINGITEAR